MKKIRLVRILFLMIFITAVMLVSGIIPGSASAAVLKELQISRSPGSVKVKLTGKTPYKVIRMDKKEVLIAFQNTTISRSFKKKGAGKPSINSVSVRKLPNRVVTIVIKTGKELKDIRTRWLYQEKALIVNLSGSGWAYKQKVAVKPKKFRQGEYDVGVPKTVFSQKLYKPGKSTGNLDDLLNVLAKDDCFQTYMLSKALGFSMQFKWLDAYNALSSYIESSKNGRCLEKVFYLRAYCYYKMLKEVNEFQYIHAAKLFQDVISYYPDSRLKPYALAALGKIHSKLGNTAESLGYFKLTEENYPKYSGMPEVIYEIGKGYMSGGEIKQGIEYYKKIMKNYKSSMYIPDATMGLGIARYELGNYMESLRLLNGVMKKYPGKEYEKKEILLYTGHSYFHSGNSRLARERLNMAINLFPEIKERDIILTRIGDTYANEKNNEKAAGIYKLVIDNYPATDGFVQSSMGMAEVVDKREDKEKIYKMVIREFSDHALSRLAMMKLAQLYNRAGEYENCIVTIKDLLKTKPRALKKEAVTLMNEASLSLFKILAEENKYPVILSKFEEDKRILMKAVNPDMFVLVGRSYSKAHLYIQAIDVLLTAYKRIGKGKRPGELLFDLAVSMHEVGLANDAIGKLDEYLKYFPKGDHAVQVLIRKGAILVSKKSYTSANQNFNKAYDMSGENKEKAEILIEKAKVYKRVGNLKSVSSSLIRAINQLASAPEEHFETIFSAHRFLGENYMSLKAYEKAADAFSMALKFSVKDRNNSDIRFMLADAYHKSGVSLEAIREYESIIEGGDAFWSKLAEERLREIKLENRLR